MTTFISLEILGIYNVYAYKFYEYEYIVWMCIVMYHIYAYYRSVYICTHTPVFVTVPIYVGISKHLCTNSVYGHTVSVSAGCRVRVK